MASGPSKHRVIPEWIFISLLITTGAAIIAHNNWLWRWDLALYDSQFQFWERPVPDDVVIVAIDDASLQELGRWPWDRSLHARLIRRLTAEGVKAIAIDIVFSEENRVHPEGDRELIDAVADAGNVFLPVFVEQLRLGGQLVETLPIPDLSEVAAGLGHVHVDLDPDGIARRTYLKEGVGSAFWPALPVALLRYLEPGQWDTLPGARNPNKASGSPHIIYRDNEVYIPFAGPPGHFPRLSFSQVLKGDFLPGALKDKIVFVGTTATGLSDSLPTPVSKESRPMAGVEINVNLFDALRHHSTIVPLAPGGHVVLTVILVLLPLLLYPHLRPRNVLILTLAMLLFAIGLSFYMLHGLHVWSPPMAILLSFLISYPIWSWRRLEYASRYLDQEMERLRREPSPITYPQDLGALTHSLIFLQSSLPIDGWVIHEDKAGPVARRGDLAPEISPPGDLAPGQWRPANNAYWLPIPRNGASWVLGVRCTACHDASAPPLRLVRDLATLFSQQDDTPPRSTTELMEQRIGEVSRAVEQLRSAHGLLFRTLEQMGDALIVANSGGTVLLANSAAQHYLATAEEEPETLHHLGELTRHIAIEGSDTWETLFKQVMLDRRKVHFEGRHSSGAEVFVQISPWVEEDNHLSGMIVTVADISFMKQSERKRAEALSFLSHDLRSPLTSLLSLVELYRQKNSHIAPEDFPTHVERYTRKAMKLADGFLQMARAENATSDRFHELEFIGIVHNAIDEGYSSALSKEIKLQRHIDMDEALVLGDADLLERALFNLIHNAIQYSPEGSRIDIRVTVSNDRVECCVEDQGPGIALEHYESIFNPFQRLSDGSQIHKSGTGLGLAFVKIVAQKHHGAISVANSGQGGARFCLTLPLAPTGEG